MRPKSFKSRPRMRRSDEHSILADDALGYEFEEVLSAQGDLIPVKIRSPLAMTVIQFRARSILCRDKDRPSAGDTQETLKKLSKMSQSEAAARWSELDAAVDSEIDRAHLALFRQANGPTILYEQGWEYQVSGPDNIPWLAEYALQTMQKNKGGSPNITGLSVMFASALAAHWRSIQGENPTVNIVDLEPTKFQIWARCMFEQAGYPVGDIYKFLRDGVKAAKDSGHIPTK